MATPRKILTPNAISAKGLARLPEHYTVGGDIAELDGILVRSANMHEMDIPTSVQGIARAGAGANNIPVDKLSKLGIPVFNAPGANSNAVKELVIAGMLLAARHLGPPAFSQGLNGSDADQQGGGSRQEELCRLRVARPYARCRRSRRHRTFGGECRAGAWHEGGRLRPGYHRGRCLALPPTSRGPTAWRSCCVRWIS